MNIEYNKTLPRDFFSWKGLAHSAYKERKKYLWMKLYETNRKAMYFSLCVK